MKSINYIAGLLFIINITGCIVQFIPKTDENQTLLVVEGLITDQPGENTIKLSESVPLGIRATEKPLKGCTVSITDDLDNTFLLTESSIPGTYLTDSATFRGVAGRKYTLHIKTNNSMTTHYSYESLPMEMIPVPPVDSLFYEKVIIKAADGSSGPAEGCQVYLNTYDPQSTCKFYRWDYIETWEFQLPEEFDNIINSTCWITNNSTDINIKNTTELTQNKISRFPLKFISNETDRLSIRYSILVNQYSVSEDEFNYWEKMQRISEEVGTLYDITPSSIEGNIFCVEDPEEQVLGYFSVSAVSSKRIYIDGKFKGLVNIYSRCYEVEIHPQDANAPPPGYWIIIDHSDYDDPYKIITYDNSCVDCTVRGTSTKPDFWEDVK
jgi:hypothetical protein